MKIQKLEPSRHKQGRWLVFLDNGALLRLGEGDVARLSLYAGKELDASAAEELAAAQRQGRVNEKALDLLSARPMSRKELEDKLTFSARRRRAGEEPPDPETLEREREERRRMARSAADRLEELGLLNDREYACTVARHYAAKGYGMRRLRDELYRRGVPREYWDEALEGAETEQGGGSMAGKLLQARLRGAEPTRENLKRASDYLARRGFGWQEISEAIERYRNEYEDGSNG